MREISLVKRLKFNFVGSVTKNALVIGDADNDQCNELVCANLQGDLAIFKDKSPNSYAYATDLGMVTACVIGDVINAGKNFVAAINTEGWLLIFDVNGRPSDGPTVASDDCSPSAADAVPNSNPGMKLNALYDQRMPANCKELLLADLDGDGQNEVIVCLTDRVLRTYKWIKIGADRGKFVGLYKWEFADQIGAVSLNPSRHENCQDIIVAQPGGTYAKLECFDKKPTSVSNTTPNGSSSDPNQAEEVTPKPHINELPSDEAVDSDVDNVRTEYISKLTPEYHQLALAQMRNHHISTEVLGGIKHGKNSESYSLIVIATLDGTLMLVNKDEILWSLQVDHQLFALAVLEPTKYEPHPMLSQSESTCTIVHNPKLDDETFHKVQRRGPQYFVACAWNGKTYIIDEERNYLRFKFDEAVSAFTAGNYHFDGRDHASLVYASFNNQIILYYDVILDQIRPMYLLDEVMNNPEHASLLKQLETIAERLGLSGEDEAEHDENTAGNTNEDYASEIHDLLQSALYSVTDDEIITIPE